MQQSRIGRTFGRLTVLDLSEKSPHGNGNHIYVCRCECGAMRTARWSNLNEGRVKSCGCLRAERSAEAAAKRSDRTSSAVARAKKTKLAGHPLEAVYRGMLRRCYNPKQQSYRFYGGRGVVVCNEWKDSFAAFVSDMGARPPGTTLDRKNPDGPYNKDNCRWATKIEQFSHIRNTTPMYVATIDGATRALTDWARKFGLNPEKLKRDVRNGVDPAEAVVASVLRRKLWLQSPKQTPQAWAACTAVARKKLGLD